MPEVAALAPPAADVSLKRALDRTSDKDAHSNSHEVVYVPVEVVAPVSKKRRVKEAVEKLAEPSKAISERYTHSAILFFIS